MLAQASPWHVHALQRTQHSPAQPLPVPRRMEWTTRPGLGPGSEILGTDLRRMRVLELGCGPGHNVAYLAARRAAIATGVDLVGLQVRRARSHYGRLAGVTFAAGHALHYLQATDKPYDAICSVFGAVGLVDPKLLLPAIADRLRPGRILAFSVPHPARGGRRPSLALRHLFASEAIKEGVDVYTLADLLGHEDPASTLRRYVHRVTGAVEKARKAIGRRYRLAA